MRTTIEIDDELLREAWCVTGQRTERAAVEEGLKLLIRLRRQEDVDQLFGRLTWDDDLDRNRSDGGA